MRVLVACEESQEVCKAFRARGHEAYSCDYQECSGGHPEWHIVADVLTVIKGGWFKTQAGNTVYVEMWDLMIAHPPCTYLSNVGQACKTRDNAKEFREARAIEAIAFVDKLWNSGIKKVMIENPVGQLNTKWKRPSQIIQPYYFGDHEMKTTCLWLRGLPRLNGLHHIDRKKDKPKPVPGKSRIGSDGKVKNVYFTGRMDRSTDSKTAAKLKSKTFPGIARAMAEQWG